MVITLDFANFPFVIGVFLPVTILFIVISAVTFAFIRSFADYSP